MIFKKKFGAKDLVIALLLYRFFKADFDSAQDSFDGEYVSQNLLD